MVAIYRLLHYNFKPIKWLVGTLQKRSINHLDLCRRMSSAIVINFASHYQNKTPVHRQRPKLIRGSAMRQWEKEGSVDAHSVDCE